MSCCGACGGQNHEKEKSDEKAGEQKPEQTQASVEQFDPFKK